jgi:hypothetical protein
MSSVKKIKNIFPVVTSITSTIASNTNKSWSFDCAAMSSNGSVIYACASSDYLYKSVDGGLTFQADTELGQKEWVDIATSSDGIYVIVAEQSGGLYISLDGGLIWNTKIGTKNWSAVSISSTGSKMAASVNGERIYISRDFGLNWQADSELPTGNWTCVKISGDGNKFFATKENELFRGTDNGIFISWSFTTGLNTFINVSVSFTGQYLICSSRGINVQNFRSTDFGLNLLGIDGGGGPGIENTSLAISSNGQYMSIYNGINGNLIFSSNFGENFSDVNLDSSRRFIVMSSDGLIQYVGRFNTTAFKSVNGASSFTEIPLTTTVNINSVSYINAETNRKTTSPKI